MRPKQIAKFIPTIQAIEWTNLSDWWSMMCILEVSFLSTWSIDLLLLLLFMLLLLLRWSPLLDDEVEEADDDDEVTGGCGSVTR